MSDAVIVAIITGLCAVFGEWLVARKQAEEIRSNNVERDARIDERLKNVEDKLDVHNGYADKITSIVTDIAVIKNDIKTLYKGKV